MSGTDSQNVDPFAASFEPLYREGRLIDVPLLQGVDPAHSNNARREAVRAELVRDRVPPARPREAVLADLRAQRAEAVAFIEKADRVLAPAPASASQSAIVDAILAEEGVTEDAWAEREARLAAEGEGA
jgi:hypothetical protein